MSLSLYNTMGRTLEPFVPIEAGTVRMYCCGPTVYSYAHIGNLRTYVFEDLLRRVLEYDGYRVRHVMNVTDVGHLTDDGDEGEDKMIVGARERGMTVWQIAEHFTEAFFRDADRLNILRPHVTCRATEHIPQMVRLVERLQEKGLTYEAGGNIYFSIDAFADYGKLALLERSELQAGARVTVDSLKRNPHDFVLWFTNSKYEHQAMLWDSPWGRGYPGWHLECSAMSMEYLGDRIDIHCGGIDHVNVHHTNEIAQSEGAVGHRWVNYWLHGEFLLLESGRMGKSKGNYLTLSSLEEEGYEPLDYRYFLLGAHYRTQLTFSEEAMDGARSARRSLVDRLRDLAGRAEPEPGDGARSLLVPVREAFDEDLNVPRALGLVRSLLKEENVPPGVRLAAALDADTVFGLKLRESVYDERRSLPEGAEALLEARAHARAVRDYAKADALRSELRAMGVLVEDGPSDTSWKLE